LKIPLLMKKSLLAVLLFLCFSSARAQYFTTMDLAIGSCGVTCGNLYVIFEITDGTNFYYSNPVFVDNSVCPGPQDIDWKTDMANPSWWNGAHPTLYPHDALGLWVSRSKIVEDPSCPGAASSPWYNGQLNCMTPSVTLTPTSCSSCTRPVIVDGGGGNGPSCTTPAPFTSFTYTLLITQ